LNDGGIRNTPSGYDDDGRLCVSTSSRSAGAGMPLFDVEIPGTLTDTCRPALPAPPSIGPSEPDPGC
jgi:hypothetical protein